MSRLSVKDAFLLGDREFERQIGQSLSEEQAALVRRTSMSGVTPYIDSSWTRSRLSEGQREALARRGIQVGASPPDGRRRPGVLAYVVTVPAEMVVTTDDLSLMKNENVGSQEGANTFDVLVALCFADGEVVSQWNVNWAPVVSR